MMETILTDVDGSGVATVTLNRPEVHNAFDGVMVAELDIVFRDFGRREDVRVIKLAAAGTSFSAGADLAWMRKLAEGSEAANRTDAERLARMLHGLAGLPKPTIALVQGPADGGGVGLIAACDIAIAAEEARFALSEVRLGLVPAVIGPYVVAAVGQRWARRLFLTAERIDARLAERIGLVHEVVTADRLAA